VTIKDKIALRKEVNIMAKKKEKKEKKKKKKDAPK
jgi:hypothetical protein